MRRWAWCVGSLLLGCSSTSGPLAPGDAGTHDAHHDARPHDSGPVRTVCEPMGSDGGVKDGSPDGAGDAGAKDDGGKDAAGDGPVHCTTDDVCPKGDICDKAMGLCVMNDGTTFCSGEPDGGGVPGKCSANSDDMCCTATAGCIARPPPPVAGGPACCPGPAGDRYCQGKLGNDTATCTGNVCTTCMDTCISANPTAYQRFLAHQVADCGCVADGACYAACHTATSSAPGSGCGDCLAAQTQEGLASTCTLAAAADCSMDPDCTAYQACAGMCPM